MLWNAAYEYIFGGTLYQNLETEINHTSNDHGIRVIDDFILNKGEFTVNSSHHQAIKSIGEGLEIFCMAKDGVIEGFYLKGHPFLLEYSGILKGIQAKLL